MAAKLDGYSQFLKSGKQRLEDALELMELPTRESTRSDKNSRHLRGAMYLSGYAVESLIKTYLIRSENCYSLTNAEDKINKRRQLRGEPPIEQITRSAAGHNITLLLTLTDIPDLPGYDRKLWGRVSQWRSVWRYDDSGVAREEAEAFLQDVEAVVRWLRPKIY